MGKGSSSSAPAYPISNVSTGGLYGSSTTSQFGTTYNPTQFQKQLVGQVESYVPSLIDYMVNPTTDNAYYQAQKNVRQQAQNDALENQVINPLASRNLTRGSAGQSLINSYADSVARQEAQALADSQGQTSALLSQLMGIYEVPYNMMTGINQLSLGGANSVADYNMNKYQADIAKQASKYQLYGSLANAVGTAVGGMK